MISSKKGGLSIAFIVSAAIAILVLVIVIFIFYGGASTFKNKILRCETYGGTCLVSGDSNIEACGKKDAFDYVRSGLLKCSDKKGNECTNQVCVKIDKEKNECKDIKSTTECTVEESSTSPSASGITNPPANPKPTCQECAKSPGKEGCDSKITPAWDCACTQEEGEALGPNYYVKGYCPSTNPSDKNYYCCDKREKQKLIAPAPKFYDESLKEISPLTLTDPSNTIVYATASSEGFGAQTCAAVISLTLREQTGSSGTTPKVESKPPIIQNENSCLKIPIRIRHDGGKYEKAEITIHSFGKKYSITDINGIAEAIKEQNKALHKSETLTVTYTKSSKTDGEPVVVVSTSTSPASSTSTEPKITWSYSLDNGNDNPISNPPTEISVFPNADSVYFTAKKGSSKLDSCTYNVEAPANNGNTEFTYNFKGDCVKDEFKLDHWYSRPLQSKYDSIKFTLTADSQDTEVIFKVSN